MFLQMERDDVVTGVDILKEKYEKAQIMLSKALEDKETANKEFERMLEKYDRFVCSFKNENYLFYRIDFSRSVSRLPYTVHGGRAEV